MDKTALIYELVTTGKANFLSRPRRFGKSLLISTLESLFNGEKALFEGLFIAQTDYDFATYPVITMEFSRDEFTTADNLRELILNSVDYYAEQFEIVLSRTTFAQRFDELVTKLHHKTGQKVVLLVDEYDKPILNNLNKPVLTEIKQVLSAFYASAKALDKHLQFIFITGVSKFAKVSVFSGMNNLTDISLNKKYATLCGVTEQELQNNFSEAIVQLAQQENQSTTDLSAQIKYWYNGYYFEENAPSVYNPYSLLSLFSHQKFQNYWYTTATPTFLLNLLQETQYDLKNLSQFEIGASAFAASEPEDMSVLSLFVQTGYLTIKGYNAPLYVLDFPNFEVKSSFYESVVTRYGHLQSGLSEAYTHRLTQYLKSNKLDEFFETLGVFFANIPYDITI
ncbi:MAG: AAA family ATPase, partial [Psychrosphaera sp.]|nr:AAA family ATPase [Psychrosphaera sp.]